MREPRDEPPDDQRNFSHIESPARGDDDADPAASADSALHGHVDYVDLAERVVQGISVESPPGGPQRPRRRAK